ncbi:hypothetical protein CAF53_02490 [Sphingobium sp. LB126]|uniref:hypothetical protein n=1 Tax=Sphingobium sp. LB126 TaxID=1983755 RepID=UPI000C206DA9|nr:hypothetical protein [Sphingobium sp. LB126]PJG47233.1 hypothetical protein CAF53_02490 [Sphingobium sp. LB126]
MSDAFDPADAGTWIARGRKAHHAEALAHAWQCFPDLPNDAPLDARIARTRQRIQMLRPLHDEITRETEAERQRKNFAFAQHQVADGKDDGRYTVILHARDTHGYEWNPAVAYGDGHHAARAGWDFRFIGNERSKDFEHCRNAYRHGFRDGGGQPEDIFDTARRAFAAVPSATLPSAKISVPDASCPRPSQWPNPSDQPAPTSWRRRLLVLGRAELDTGAIGLLDLLRAIPGHDGAMVLIAAPDASLRFYDLLTGYADHLDVGLILQQAALDDILIAADGPDLATIDAAAHRLPIVRNMERTRNSALQQRAQFRIWLARGRAPGDQFAAGHIRWGKMAAGLSGRLGGFTARYAGPAQPSGHRIVIEDASGAPAQGYRSAGGDPLEPEIVITNRAHLRACMTAQLRSFAAGLRF